MRTLVLFTRSVLLSPFAAAPRSHQVMSRHWKDIVSSFIYFIRLNLFGHLLQILAVFGLKRVNNTHIFCIFHLKKLMEELCCAAEEFEEKKKIQIKNLYKTSTNIIHFKPNTKVIKILKFQLFERSVFKIATNVLEF